LSVPRVTVIDKPSCHIIAEHEVSDWVLTVLARLETAVFVRSSGSGTLPQPRLPVDAALHSRAARNFLRPPSLTFTSRMHKRDTG